MMKTISVTPPTGEDELDILRSCNPIALCQKIQKCIIYLLVHASTQSFHPWSKKFSEHTLGLLGMGEEVLAKKPQIQM